MLTYAQVPVHQVLASKKRPPVLNSSIDHSAIEQIRSSVYGGRRCRQVRTTLEILLSVSYLLDSSRRPFMVHIDSQQRTTQPEKRTQKTESLTGLPMVAVAGLM